ncbi:MAG: DegV family protein [Anaerolineaceae bacterium]|nr:DegV family protein [Anaerolineaceae bacterium]
MSKTRIAVVTDSSAYMPASSLEGLNVSVIPLWLNWDGEQFLDGVDIDPPTFYSRLKKSKTLPTSSQPSVKEFEDFFRKVAEKSDAIVSVLASSKISGTVASAMAAQKNLSEKTIRVVDSLAASMGMGFIVLAAARAASDGKTVEQVVEAAEKMRQKVHFLFVVDTLEYLHRGGRIGGAKRLFGTALQIKPLLEFADGLIQPLSQARTKRKALELMYKIAKQRLAGKQMAEAAIVDIDSIEEGDAVADKIKEQFNPPILHRSGVSPVVGTHVGPGAIGLAFYAE